MARNGCAPIRCDVHGCTARGPGATGVRRASVPLAGRWVRIVLLRNDPLHESFSLPSLTTARADEPVLLGRAEDGPTLTHALADAAHLHVAVYALIREGSRAAARAAIERASTAGVSVSGRRHPRRISVCRLRHFRLPNLGTPRPRGAAGSRDRGRARQSQELLAFVRLRRLFRRGRRSAR